MTPPPRPLPSLLASGRGRVIFLVVLLATSWPLLAVLHQPIDGAHYSRQSLVQSNIELFLAGGSLVHPDTYNHAVPPTLFELPVYQWLVAGLSWVGSTDPLPTARAVNIGLLLVGLLLVEALLAELGASWLLRGASLLLIALSPLQAHYSSSPLSDCLVVTLGLVALLGYAKTQRAEGEHGLLALGWMAAAAWLGAAIKAPTLLPVCVAILIDQLRGGGVRRLFGSVSLTFAVACLAGIGTHLTARELANRGVPTVNEKAAWIFGPLSDRFDPELWRPLLATALHQVLIWPGTLVAAAALVILRLPGTGTRPRGRTLLEAWMVAGLVYVLVFHSLCRKHDYYLLPLVAPFAIQAALGLEVLARALAPSARKRALAATVGLTLLGAAVIVHHRGGLAGLRHPYASDLQAAGSFIEANTNANDLVLYVTEVHQDNNSYRLYAARRHGMHLGIDALESLTPLRISMLVEHHLGPHQAELRGELIVFVPTPLALRFEALPLVGLLTPAAQGSAGKLYRFSLEP